jgi:hypothetical protein
MSIIPYSGRAAIAQAIFSMPVHLAIGSGGVDWGETAPPLDYDATALVNEVGRKVLHRGLYVYPDEYGEIILPNDKHYSTSLTPTRYLYLQFLFNYNEGAGFALRELGIFVNTTYVSQPQQGQTYFTPEEIEDPGMLLYLNHPQDPDRYNPQKKGGYEVVIVF